MSFAVRAARIIDTAGAVLGVEATPLAVRLSDGAAFVGAALDTTLAAMSAKLPPSLGGKAAANSLTVALSTEDAAKVPPLGQALAAGSMPVVLPATQVSGALAPAKAGIQELPAAMEVERYSTEIAAVSVDPAAAPLIYNCDPSSANPVALVYTTASHTFTEPNAANKTLALPIAVVDVLRARDSGFTVTIPPGSSGVLECDQDGGNVQAVFVASWDEVPI